MRRRKYTQSTWSGKKLRTEKEIVDFIGSGRLQHEVLDAVNLTVFWKLYRSGMFIYEHLGDEQELRSFKPSNKGEKDVYEN